MRDQPLYQELVPLPEATAVAHHLLFDRAPARRGQEELATARADMAVALAAISKIFFDEGGQLRPLSLGELQGLLVQAEAARVLSILYIRRCDLIRAIETFQQLQTQPFRAQSASRG